MITSQSRQQDAFAANARKRDIVRVCPALRSVVAGALLESRQQKAGPLGSPLAPLGSRRAGGVLRPYFIIGGNRFRRERERTVESHERFLTNGDLGWDHRRVVARYKKCLQNFQF